MRAECATQAFLDVCSRPLYWAEVPCDIYAIALEEQGEEEDFSLPLYVVIPVQLLAAFWEFHVIGMITLPWYLIVLTVAIFDWLLDWVWLGLFFWCDFCAGVMIWLINILMLPFHIWGWMQRFHLETYGLVVDGWMLFFGFSGCYLAFGKHCWLKADWGNTREAIDIPLMFTNPGGMLTEGTSADSDDNISSFFMPPKLESGEDLMAYRRNSRANWFKYFPGYNMVSAASAEMMELFEL